jgi:hypothetical protein
MSKNLEIALSLLLKGQQSVVSGVRAVGRGITGRGDAARGATGEVRRLYEAANGFSTASRLIGMAGAAALLKNTEDTVLVFQRLQLVFPARVGMNRFVSEKLGTS